MNIDFSKLGGNDASDTITHPRDLWSVLPNKDKRFDGYPRDVQGQVWEQWYSRRHERDLTIKMNTGGGKTVVGLVLLKSCLNESVGPALYVAPNPFLVQQVLNEAKLLGIEVTEDPRSSRYSSGRAICVVSINRLINGKSVFGVGDEGIQIPIGSVVVDDAHACLAASEEQFSIQVTSSDPVYKSLLALFFKDLEHVSPTGALEVRDEDPSKNMVVPFWAWIDKQDKVVEILHAARETESLQFRYPLLKEHLSLCECVFGGGKVEISARCLPIGVIPAFGTASRRIFMSATIGDDGILVSHFDASSDSISRPITPASAGDIGDRMILVPQQINPDFTDEQLIAYFGRYSNWTNVVVLVPSDYRARAWSGVATQTLRASNLQDGIASLRSGHVGLTVLVNKYDGIDLPDDACRILVVDGLPDVRGQLEKIEQGVLLGSEAALRDSVQRVEQGMGRGIRSSEDYCAVFLMGRSLTRQLYARNAKSFLTPATRAQLDLSEQLTEQMQQPTIKEMHSVVKRFLDREVGWVKASKAAVVRAKPTAVGTMSAVPICQRNAFNAASRRDFKQAVREMQKAADAAGEDRVKGWLLWQLAEYEHRIDAARAQKVLRQAVELSPQVIRPIDGIDYVRLPSKLARQASECLGYLREKYDDSNVFLIDVHSILDAVAFQPNSASRFESALAELARILGFASQEPERDFGRGPDVLWSMGQQRFLVIECKNEAVVETISKGYCNQLTGSVMWFVEKYGETCTAVPLLVHPAGVIEYAATMHPDARVIREEELDKLRSAVKAFAAAVSGKSRFGSEEEVAEILTYHRLTAEHFVSTFSSKVRGKK